MADSRVVKYKLAKEYANFTGMLTSILPCKEGVVTIPAAAEAKSGLILETHYGAKKIVEGAPAQETKK